MDVSNRTRARVPDARRLATEILAAEGTTHAVLSIAFVGEIGIRRLNRDHLGHDRVTDVIAFSLAPAPGSAQGAPAPVVGDVYICPAVAARNARAAGVTPREELRRLVVHGTLHVLGYDHPEGERRTASDMWRRQERYLRRFR